MVRFIFFLLCLINISIFSQQLNLPGTSSSEDSAENPVQYLPQAIVPLSAVADTADNLQLAISNRQYPVTPGDVYELTFLLAGETVSNTLLVESDYTINMTIFGKLNALGMTFAELKPVVEEKIANAYPRSLPSLTIRSVGVFQVPIMGEIPESRYVTAWGLSRLSQILDDNLGIYSSIRDVEIISGKGESIKYDLIQALNLGVLAQNPTIKPDDIIVINRIRREIQILGEVYKPGTYQLLDNETIGDVEKFTGGFTPLANPAGIHVERFSGIQPTSFILTEEAFKRFDLHHGDIISIPSKVRIQPVVYVEGAIIENLDSTALTATAIDEYGRVVHPINKGESLYHILDALRDNLTAFAELENGYILRKSGPIAVDMQELLYHYNPALDIILEPYDQVIIPVKRPNVYVTGAVISPGAYPYQPDADFLYYINLAAGFDVLRNSYSEAIVFDKEGKRRKPGEPIQSGDTVNALSNNFLYNFNQYFPAIATGLGLIITIITITQALNENVVSD